MRKLLNETNGIKSNRRVVIIIPTYNEAMTLETTVLALQAAIVDLSAYTIQLLIFDSASTDATIQIVNTLKQQYQNIVLVQEPEKSGLGSAYQQAMTYAMETLHADIVFEFDADGSHQPGYIPEMLAQFDQGADVVVGSRYVKGGSIPNNWQLHRKFLSIMGNWVARLLLTPRYRDFTSGFRATRTTFLRQIHLSQLLSKNYAYKIHLMWALHKLGANIVEYPIIFIDREKGLSKFPRNNTLESLQLVCRLRLRELHCYLKICLVGAISAAIQLTVFNLIQVKWRAPLIANAIAIECAILSNFILNNYLTFSHHRFHFTQQCFQSLKKFLWFNFSSLGSLCLQLIILKCGLHLTSHTTHYANLWVIIGIFLGSMLNYFVYTRWIWKRAKS